MSIFKNLFFLKGIIISSPSPHLLRWSANSVAPWMLTYKHVEQNLWWCFKKLWMGDTALLRRLLVKAQLYRDDWQENEAFRIGEKSFVCFGM